MSQKMRVSAGEMYSRISRMGRGSPWSQFDINQSTFHEDMH